MCLVTFSFAAPFSPTPLEISVQDWITCAFDGTDVDIPVEISGKSAKCYLIINTRLPEAQLPHQVQNGYLGWHYVNKIDTTVYISGAYNFAPGSHTITWDGYGTENTSGGYGGTYEKFDRVIPGDYDYYVWGYDYQSSREPACNFLPISFYWQPQYTKFGEYDEAGLPRTNPLIWGNIPWMYDNLHGVGPPRWTAFKLPLGTDPDDISKLQTTFMPGFSKEYEYDASPISFDPFDQNYFYNFHVYTDQMMGALFKWHWVSGGDAEIVTDWGGWDDLAYATASRRGIGEYMEAVRTDGEYIYIASPARNPLIGIQHDWLWIVDFDGEKVANQLLDDFYTPDNPMPLYTNGMINKMFASSEFPYQAILGGEQHCLIEMVDANRIASGEGDNEYVMWKNGNGDFFFDASWDPVLTIEGTLWECNTGEYKDENMGRHSELFFDSEGIVLGFADYQGLNSFVVFTQDGSGIAYCKFADDTVVSNKNKKGSGQRVDTGSQFDGLYIGDVVMDDIRYGTTTQHINWVGFDSAHGLISAGHPHHVLTMAVNQAEWGTTDPSVGDHIFYEITLVNITALPDSGYRFINWTGDVADPNIATTTVTMDSNKTVTANFEIIPSYHYQLDVSNTGNNATILITTASIPTINNEPIVTGDCIGVFTPRGQCAGAGIWEGENLSIMVWGDDSDEPGVLGFQTGESLLYKIRDSSEEAQCNAMATYSQGEGTYATDEIFVLSSLYGSSNEFTIHLESGWNMISSNMISDVPSMEAIFVDIIGNVIVAKNGEGQVFWPALMINQIGDWEITDGYKVKMKTADDLRITGQYVQPDEITYDLAMGWNLISFIAPDGMSPANAFAQIVEDIIIVKNREGQVYWPNYGIDQINALHLGEGYKIKLSSAVTFSYPSSVSKISVASASAADPSHFIPVLNTGYNSTITITTFSTQLLCETPLAIGVEIGVFCAGELCVGAAVWEGKNTAITVWGDDQDTVETIEGIRAGEEYMFKIWQKATDTEYNAIATYSTGSSKYVLDAIVVLESLTGEEIPSSVEDLHTPNKFILSQNSPNPFNSSTTIEYAIPAGISEQVCLKVYDLRGALVRTLVDEVHDSGVHSALWDGTDETGNKVSSGIYIYRLQAGKFNKSNKMLLVK